MYAFITTLIIIVCVILILAVLIQNPKGGGLGATFGGVGNQVMGARKATDFIEKTTWTLVVILLVLSLGSGLFLPKENIKQERSQEEDKELQENMVPDNAFTFPEEEPTDQGQDQGEQQNP